MKLNLEQVKKITTGAVKIEEKDNFFSFSRFTDEQLNLYKTNKQDLYQKALSSAGVKLSFKTNSNRLFLKIKTFYSSSRKCFALDVFVNESYIGCIDNFSNMQLPEDYTKLEFLAGDYSKGFDLGDGEKTVCVHLPWSVETLIEEISIDDGALIEEVKNEKTLLAFGDSITHGYDALHPSNRYISILADKLCADELNKAIGGELFFPELASLKEPFNPDYITVAYGTNDWNNVDKETFIANCKGFYNNLSDLYPDAKIFAITPIWRKDAFEERKFGKFEEVGQCISGIVSDIKNITVISGYNFVPKEEKYFADLRLHPNDKGFEYYAKNILEQIKDKI